MGEDLQNGGADVDLKLAGQEVRLKNIKSLNTILTLLTTIGVAVLCYAFYVHGEETKTTGKAFVDAIKEQTQAVKEQTSAAREQTCIMRFDQSQRQANAEFCKTISR